MRCNRCSIQRRGVVRHFVHVSIEMEITVGSGPDNETALATVIRHEGRQCNRPGRQRAIHVGIDVGSGDGVADDDDYVVPLVGGDRVNRADIQVKRRSATVLVVGAEIILAGVIAIHVKQPSGTGASGINVRQGAFGPGAGSMRKEPGLNRERWGIGQSCRAVRRLSLSGGPVKPIGSVRVAGDRAMNSKGYIALEGGTERRAECAKVGRGRYTGAWRGGLVEWPVA